MSGNTSPDHHGTIADSDHPRPSIDSVANGVYEFTAEIARLAMEADPSDISGLVGVLRRCREYFDVDILSVWRAADRGRYKMVAAVLADQSSRVTPVVTRTKLDFKRDLEGRGHLFIKGADLGREFEANLPDAGQLLIVPMGSIDRFAGVVAFRSSSSRTWTDEEIAAAELMPQLIFHLVTRLRLDQELARHEALLDLVDEVREISAQTTFDTRIESEVLILDAIRGFFKAKDVAIRDGGDRRFDVDDSDSLSSGDYTFVGEGQSVADHLLPFSDDGVRLEVAIGDSDSDRRVLTIGRLDGRRWTNGEVSAIRTVADLIRRLTQRVNEEHALKRRLSLEALTAGISAGFVDAKVANIDEKLDNTLQSLVDYFALKHASLWSYEDGCAVCRKSCDPLGIHELDGVSIEAGDISTLESRGWDVVGSDQVAGMIGPDSSSDSEHKALMAAVRGPVDALGSLVLVDSKRTQWCDDEIHAVRAIADVVGHVRRRLSVDRRRQGEQRINEILAEMSKWLLNADSTGARVAIKPALESLRSYFDLASVAVWEVEQGSRESRCASEVVGPGEFAISHLVPIGFDHAIVREIRNSTEPISWRVPSDVDLASGGRLLVALPIRVTGDDILFLTALPAESNPITDETIAVLRSWCGILAQLHRRFSAERLSEMRRRADLVMNGILLRFIDVAVGDKINPLPEALANVGDLLGASSLELWDVDGGGSAVHRGEVWRSEVDRDLPVRGVPFLSLNHPDAMAVSSLAKAGIIQLEDSSPTQTVIGAPLILGSDLVGGLVLELDRDHVPAPELEVIEAVLDSLAALILQMRTRISAESMVVRKLALDKRLGELAAGLVRTTSRDPSATDDAFKTLCGTAEIDMALLCRVDHTDTGVELTLINHAGTKLVEPVPTEFTEALFPRDVNFQLSEAGPTLGQWTLPSAPDPLPDIMSAIAPTGDRSVAVAGRAAGDTSAMYLLVSRPGFELFDEAEVDYLKSALSMLTEHDGRMTAEAWFSAAIGHAPIAMSMRDVHMNLITCNSAYENLTGSTLAELQDTDLHDVLTEDDAVYCTDRQENRPDEDHVTLEIRYDRPDGSVAWGRLQSTPVFLPGRRHPYRLTYVEDITKVRRHRELLEWQATHDELTGLPNRRMFLTQANQRLEQSRDDAMMVLDLDRFKVVNDSLGHSVGDRLLVVCADRIRLSLRPGDLLCRLGGDEFAILLTSPADMPTASAVADRLLALLREPTQMGDLEVFPTASIGIAIPQPEDSIDDLLRHADSAMYQSKSSGRDRWTGFDSSMREAVLDRVRTETDLRLAIENGQLEVHYQPEITMSSGAIVGAEALVRWRHPELGLLTAGAFIDVAEESGIVVDLGRWVLGVATRQAAAWIAQGHDIIIRVNLSARQVRPAVVAEVEDALQAAGLPAERLCLELTETAIMDDIDESEAILARLHNLGVKLAIDDFGTGFSSLAYLKKLPVDILKIDRSFVAGVGVDSDDTSIVASVIALASALSLDVVAEGIETPLQQRELLKLGCERGQGFYLARPAPADDVEILLGSSSQI